MTIRTKNLFVSALIALSLTLTLAVMARAQTAAPDAPVAPEAPAEAAPAPAEAATPPESEATAADVRETPVEAETPAGDDDLRRLDGDADSESTEVTTSVAWIKVSVDNEDADEADDSGVVIGYSSRRRGPAEEMPFGDHTVPAGSTVRELVSVRGNSVLDGVSQRGVVSVLGSSTVNGHSGDDVVSILGTTTVNGQVDGDTLAVVGDVVLGPESVVQGDVITVLGSMRRAEGSVVKGNIQEINIFQGADMGWLRTWFYRCALLGRPLAFGQDLAWAWTLAIGVFVGYVFLALLFPRAVEKCVETFEQRPGYTLLAVLLSVLLAPVLVLLLIATGIGIFLIPFVVIGIFAGTIFGKAVVHAWLGRRITRYFGSGAMNHVAVATLVGGVILLLLYTVPFLGFFLWKVLGMIGLGIVIYTLILTTRKEPAAAETTPVPPPPLGGSAADGATVATAVPIAALPRAGFWHRLIATALDVVLIAVLSGLTHTGSVFLLWLSVYHVAMWALRGTTIGGIVFNLKVVRVDDRPVDWLVAVVRCLASFLSFIVIGLGFVWVAFDREKQSWHDKIAGTYIVRVPKGVSLL
ncbi:MAG: RDD family protein [Cephaloticoccus sp.]